MSRLSIQMRIFCRFHAERGAGFQPAVSAFKPTSRRDLSRRLVAALAALCLASCGYHVGGKADLMPASVHTIAIPAFSSLSTRYKLVDMLPEEIGREFIGRTRFRVEPDPNVADAVLHGSVTSVGVYPTVSDPTTSKSTSVRVNVVISVSLFERTTGRLLYSRANWSFHEDYATATDPHQFFDESGPALDRLSHDVARDVVSSVVENF